MLLSAAFRVQYKFRKFFIENVPEKFWTETEDDAKLIIPTVLSIPCSLRKEL
jgi:hypothetical protein